MIHRRLKEIKYQNISEFIREIRLKQAMELLKDHAGPASDIAFEVGFGSPTYFNKCFHEYYGYSPGEVRKRIEPKEGERNKNATGTFESSQLPSDVTVTHIIRRKNYRKVVVFLSVAFFAIAAAIVILLNVSPRKVKYPSIIVLPFKNLSDDKENQFFADGVMEDILNNLSRIKELNIVSRTTAEQFRETDLTLSEIARKVNVNYVLEGSTFRSENKVRIFVNLIDANSDQHLWSQRYDRIMTDIFAVQSDIAFQIANNLKATVSSKEIEQIRKVPTKSTEAYDYYLYGRYFLYKNPQKAILDKSIEYFNRSIAEDPDFALAYAGMARAYMLLAHYGLLPPPEGLTRAKELALEALKIDKNIAAAHCVLGNLARYQFKWEEAKKEYLLAIDCEPGNVTAHDAYGMILFATGYMDEAREQIKIAKELDPLFLDVLETSALFYLHEGKIEEMADDLRKMQEVDSGYSHVYRLYFSYYLLKADTLNAIRSLKKVCDTDPVYGKYGIELMNIYNRSGYKAAMKFWIKAEIENNNPIFVAAYLIFLDRKEEALDWLEKACEERHSMVYNIYYAWPFKSLRSEPRFKAIIEKMGLSEYIKPSHADSR